MVFICAQPLDFSLVLVQKMHFLSLLLLLSKNKFIEKVM